MPLGGGLACEYNGFTFSERMETLGIEKTPQYDASGRTVAFWRIRLRIKDTLTGSGGATTDTLMNSARTKLTSPGKELTFASTGFGNLTVNVSTVRDVAWGPKPLLLAYTPLGTKSCEIIWQVEVCIPACSTAVYQDAIMELNFRLETTIDKAGWSTRTIRGYYTIPQTRDQNGQGERLLATSADDYWESIQPEIPPGFFLAGSSHDLDETKCRCDFQIVHQERDSDNTLPPGVVSCKASHDIESAEKSMTTWFGVISAHYELARDFAPEKAWGHFFALCRQRFALMISSQESPPAGGVSNAVGAAIGLGNAIAGAIGVNTGASPGGGTATNPVATATTAPDPGANPGGADAQSRTLLGVVIPTKFSASEPDIYGRPQARFSIQYMWTQSLEKVASTSGLFMPVEGDETQWKQSLEQSAFHPRGNAKLKFDPATDDVILDLCIGADTVDLGTGQDETIQSLVGDLAQALGLEMPSPENSWLFYESRLEFEPADNVIEHKPLPMPEDVQDFGQSLIADAEFGFEEINSIQDVDLDGFFTTESSLPNVPESTTYRRTENEQVVYIVGKAMRAAYDISAPVMTAFGENEPTQACRKDKGEGFKTWVIANFGIPIIAATWRIRYVIKTRPGQTLSALAPATPFVGRPLATSGSDSVLAVSFGN